MAGINESATDVTATMNGVFKIEDETTDRLIIEAYDENESLVQSFNFDLTNLNLEKPVSVEFTEQFISLGDTDPYTVNFSVVNRPANTHLTAVSSNPSTFTVDVTSIESGSVDVTGVANGNGVLTVSVLDSSDNVIASGILPVSVDLSTGTMDVVWYEKQSPEGNMMVSPFYKAQDSATNPSISCTVFCYDKNGNAINTNTISPDDTSGRLMKVFDGNGQEIVNGFLAPNGSGTTFNPDANTALSIKTALMGQTKEYIEGCKAVLYITYQDVQNIFEANYNYYPNGY